jgi:hypothetical protein
MANSSGDSKAKSLALDPENATNMPLDVFGSTQDDMAFANLLRRRTIIDVFDWTSAKVNGDLLWKWPVHPTSCRKGAPVLVAGKHNVPCANSFLSYHANLARFWTGGIKYHFLLVKTVFHSGRLVVYWVPGADETTNLATIDRNLLYKKVFDLRNTTEFDIEIPYTHNAPWKATVDRKIANTTDAAQISYGSPTGMIVIEVINALRAPSTAADHFATVVETSAADDFQFGFPELRGDAIVALGGDSLTPPSLTYNAQDGDTIYPSVQDLTLRKNAMSMGETFLSWRQLLKRYLDPKVGGTVNYLTHPFLDQPQFAPAPADPPLATQLTTDQSLFTWASSLFRYRTGSVRVLEAYSGPVGALVDKTIAPGAYAGPGVHSDVAAPKVFSSTTIEPLVEYHVPFYQPWPALPTETGGTTRFVESLGRNYSQVPFNFGTTFFSQATSPPHSTFRQIGEDFSYGFPLGPPATWQTNLLPV